MRIFYKYSDSIKNVLQRPDQFQQTKPAPAHRSSTLCPDGVDRCFPSTQSTHISNRNGLQCPNGSNETQAEMEKASSWKWWHRGMHFWTCVQCESVEWATSQCMWRIHYVVVDSGASNSVGDDTAARASYKYTVHLALWFAHTLCVCEYDFGVKSDVIVLRSLSWPSNRSSALAAATSKNPTFILFAHFRYCSCLRIRNIWYVVILIFHHPRILCFFK